MIPLPTIPMGRLIPAKGSGKENKPCNSPTTTLQYTKMFQPGAGRSPGTSDRPPTASPRKAQPSAESTPALSKPHGSMLPAPRISQAHIIAKHAAVVDGSSFNEVKTAYRPSGGSETRTKQPKTADCAPIATSRPPLESAISTLVGNGHSAVLSVSSSLASLDAALQTMELDDDDLLAPIPAFNCSNDDLSFLATPPNLTSTLLFLRWYMTDILWFQKRDETVTTSMKAFMFPPSKGVWVSNPREVP
ncbi:hypothetical protein HD554DRAFT_634774 [Boletus coccyginus]|nr:hypothetical protein HD554DRAFT_634774 [Boletus coccyginus]